jgi:hypothetical protein
MAVRSSVTCQYSPQSQPSDSVMAATASMPASLAVVASESTCATACRARRSSSARCTSVMSWKATTAPSRRLSRVSIGRPFAT